MNSNSLKIEGVWYEVGRYNLKYDAECTVHKFEDRSNYEIGYTVSYNDLKGNIQTSFSDGLANSSKSLIILDIEDQPSIDLQFLHSDWKNFAIVYSCVQTGEATSTEQVWVLSAKPTLNVAKQVEVDEYIGTFLDLPAIEVTIQAPEHCQRALPERFLRRIANFFYK